MITPRRRVFSSVRQSARAFATSCFQFEPVAAGLGFEATLSAEKRVLVVDIGGTTDCSLLLMGPQWREKADRQQSLLGSQRLPRRR